MGQCFTQLRAELVTPPANPSNWNDLSPRRPVSIVLPKDQRGGENGAPLRKEYLSNMPGLTYDQAGRPVWREENACIEVEHRERR